MAERRQLMVMFIDLVGSTALASRLDPEEMGQILTACRNAVTGELSRPEGHVAKLMGDGASNVTQRGAQARKSGSAQPRSSWLPRWNDALWAFGSFYIGNPC